MGKLPAVVEEVTGPFHMPDILLRNPYPMIGCSFEGSDCLHEVSVIRTNAIGIKNPEDFIGGIFKTTNLGKILVLLSEMIEYDKKMNSFLQNLTLYEVKVLNRLLDKIPGLKLIPLSEN